MSSQLKHIQLNLTDVNSRLHLNTPKTQLLKIEVLIFIAVLLFWVLVCSRHFRRQCYRSTALKALDVSSNAAFFLLIPFIFGTMLSFDSKHEFLPLWATFLVFVYISVPESVNPRGGTPLQLALAKSCLYFVYVTVLMYKLQTTPFSASLLVFTIISIPRIFVKGSFSFIPLANVQTRPYLFYYLSNDDSCINASSASGDDDDPFLQCNYMVEGVRFKDGKMVDPGITISQLWGSNDASLFNFKYICLSFTLCKNLLQKYSGVPICERSETKELKFVVDGVLEIPSPFRLIEVELAFLTDSFFRKYFAYSYLFGFQYLVIEQLLFVGAISWICIVMVKRYDLRDPSVSIQYHGYDIDFVVTVVAIISITFLQLGRFIVYIASRWAKVRLICMYLTQKSWEKKYIWDWCIKIAAEKLCSERYHLNKPWERKVAQFSLLGSCTHYQNPHWRCFSDALYLCGGVKYGRQGRKEDDFKTISSDIETSVKQCLKDHGYQLRNGIGSLESNNLPTEALAKLSRGCRRSFKLDTYAQVVLAWHIATSICEFNPNLPDSVRDSPNFSVATTLSKYCAYLVAFSPELLPGHSSITYLTCTYVIEKAFILLSGCSDPDTDIYEKLMDHGDVGSEDPEDPQRETGSILHQGAVLGRVLETEITDEGKRWKVLAELWTEMILFLAPNANNHYDHAQKLSDGGEFITLLWALLYHAGITDRVTLDKRSTDASA